MIDSHELKRRDSYLNKLIGFQDTEPVKVITGIRRFNNVHDVVVGLGAEPGDIRDSKTLSNALQIATGMVTLKLSKIGAKDHRRYRYYLRITQKMKGGRKFSWSYRLPLK